jgi:hypothetical protein
LALPDEQARSRFLARSHFLAHARCLIRSSFFACGCLLDCAGVLDYACLLPLVLGASRCTIASGRQQQHVEARNARDARSGIELSPK